MNLFGGGGDNGAGEARAREARRENAIHDSQANVQSIFQNNFTDDFFGGRRQAYLDYAKPQLEDQFADARKQLIFSLDRSGTLNSTARTQKEAELAKLYGEKSRSVSDGALSYEAKARNDVAGAESDLLGGIAQSGNVGSSVNAANSRVAALSAPDIYSPLGQLFGGFTGALTTQAALERAGAYTNGEVKPSLGYIFGPNPNSVKTY